MREHPIYYGLYACGKGGSASVWLTAAVMLLHLPTLRNNCTRSRERVHRRTGVWTPRLAGSRVTHPWPHPYIITRLPELMNLPVSGCLLRSLGQAVKRVLPWRTVCPNPAHRGLGATEVLQRGVAIHLLVSQARTDTQVSTTT